jgi:hypothetical protein
MKFGHLSLLNVTSLKFPSMLHVQASSSCAISGKIKGPGVLCTVGWREMKKEQTTNKESPHGVVVLEEPGFAQFCYIFMAVMTEAGRAWCRKETPNSRVLKF